MSGDRAVDGRADIYALGCVAYFLLTGQRVFAGDDVLRVAVAHVTEAPVPPSVHVPELSEELEAVILATLEKDPIRRPDAVALLEMLDGVDVEPWTPMDAKRWWSERGVVLPPRIPADPTAATHPAVRVAFSGHA